MATIREGNRPVLIVVDVQVGVMAEAWESARVIGNIARAVARARAEGVPVVWVQHGDADLPFGSPPWQWVPALVPAAGEALIHKGFNSAFEQTGLEAELERLAATHVVLAGASTNWCIRATAYAALERGYDLTLLGDAHSTRATPLEDGRSIAAADLVNDLNIAMQWLAYPGRRNATATAATVDFTQPGGAPPA